MFSFSWDNQVHLTRTGCADVCYVICMWLFWMQQLVVTGNRSEEKQGFYICQVTHSYHGILEMAYFRHIQYIYFLSLNWQIQVWLLFSANHDFWLTRLIGKNMPLPTFIIHIQRTYTYSSLDGVQ